MTTRQQAITAILIILSTGCFLFMLWPAWDGRMPEKAVEQGGRGHEGHQEVESHRSKPSRLVAERLPNGRHQAEELQDRLRFSGECPEGQVIVTAQSEAEYRRMQERLREMGVTIRREKPSFLTINVNLTAEQRRQFEEAFGESSLEQDIPVWIPENPMEPWSGRLGPGFGRSLLSWLQVDGQDDARGSGVVVAVLDTALSKGFLQAYPGIKQMDVLGMADQGGTASHGNAVASILASEQGGVQGIAPGASLLSIPVLNDEGEGSAFDLATGIIAAVDAGADIVSMSLGCYSNSSFLQSAIAYAKERGVVLVAASGNDGASQVLYPAACEGVLAVGAIDATSTLAGFSNTGAQVDVVAPGVGLLAAGETLADTVTFSGTSAAVPCVTGILANLLSENPDLTPEAAAERLLAYSTDNGAPGKDDQYGAGVLDYARARDAQQPGIVDAAATGHYIDNAAATATAVPMVVSAQNTGTETLKTLTLDVTLDGQSSQYAFSEVAPTEVVSAVILLDRQKLEAGGESRVSSRVSASEQDCRSENDARSSRIASQKPQE